MKALQETAFRIPVHEVIWEGTVDAADQIEVEVDGKLLIYQVPENRKGFIRIFLDGFATALSDEDVAYFKIVTS